jgi:hypothetical protein
MIESQAGIVVVIRILGKSAIPVSKIPPEAVKTTATADGALIGKGSSIPEADGIRYLVLSYGDRVYVCGLADGILTTGITGGGQANREAVSCSVLVNRILTVGGIAITKVPLIVFD